MRRCRPRNAAGRACAGALALAGAALLPLACHAQRAWQIVPSIGLSETYSDNVALAAEPAAVNGWITDVTPGLRIQRNGPRLKLFLDSQFHLLRYSSLSSLGTTQRYLDSAATFEALEHWLYLDASASITQQARNAVGPVSNTPSAPSAVSNRVETRVGQFSPYVKGFFGDAVQYLGRARMAEVQAQNDVIPATRLQDASLRLGNAAAARRLAWDVEASTLTVKNDQIGSLDDSRARASIIAMVLPQFRLSAIGGYDSTEFAGPGRRSGASKGVGFAWYPSPRTQALGVYEKRFFGEAHDFAAQYRTPLTAWRMTSTRDLAVLPSLLAGGGPATSFSLMNDLLATSVVDPLERADTARQRVDTLGLAGGAPLSSGSLTTNPILYSRTELSGAYSGPRDTLVVAFEHRQQRVTGAGLGAPAAATDNNRQTSQSVRFVHRLTPLTTLGFSAASRRASLLDVPDQTSLQRQYTADWVTRLGMHASLSLGVRHVTFDGTSLFRSYRENAAVAVFTFQL